MSGIEAYEAGLEAIGNRLNYQLGELRENQTRMLEVLERIQRLTERLEAQAEALKGEVAALR